MTAGRWSAAARDRPLPRGHGEPHRVPLPAHRELEVPGVLLGLEVAEDAGDRVQQLLVARRPRTPRRARRSGRRGASAEWRRWRRSALARRGRGGASPAGAGRDRGSAACGSGGSTGTSADRGRPAAASPAPPAAGRRRAPRGPARFTGITSPQRMPGSRVRRMPPPADANTAMPASLSPTCVQRREDLAERVGTRCRGSPAHRLPVAGELHQLAVDARGRWRSRP